MWVKWLLWKHQRTDLVKQIPRQVSHMYHCQSGVASLFCCLSIFRSTQPFGVNFWAPGSFLGNDKRRSDMTQARSWSYQLNQNIAAQARERLSQMFYVEPSWRLQDVLIWDLCPGCDHFWVMLLFTTPFIRNKTGAAHLTFPRTFSWHIITIL